MQIFNFFGSILGYLLWAIYYVFQNYGVAIILFTLILKLISFPFNIKSQRSMAAQSRISGKQQELQKKYGNNREKYAEEVQKLYDKEGISMNSGCLMQLLPMLIMLGLFYAVINPLSNTLHISSDSISLATSYIQKIPGMTATGAYPELEIIRNFGALKDNLTMFTATDISKIEFFSKGFTFLGIDLLRSPSVAAFTEFLWMIPVTSLLVQYLSTFYNMRINPMAGGAQQGCMKYSMYLMPLLFVYFTYVAPAALGIYYIVSGLISFAELVARNKFFSNDHLTAKAEAQRAVTLELNEQKIKPLPVTTQKQIADKLNSSESNQFKKQSSNVSKKKSKKKGKNTNKATDSSSYQGSKK